MGVNALPGLVAAAENLQADSEHNRAEPMARVLGVIDFADEVTFDQRAGVGGANRWIAIPVRCV